MASVSPDAQGSIDELHFTVFPRVNWMGSYYVTRIDEEWAKRMLSRHGGRYGGYGWARQ